MRAFTTAAVLAVALLAVCGCGSSHEKLVGKGPSRSPFLQRALQLARAADNELRIFPAGYSHGKCLTPRALGRIHTPVKPLHGLCRTRWEVTIDAREPSALVIFTERWHWPPCLPGEDCVAGGRLLNHTWMVTVKRPVTAGQKERVLAIHQMGAQAPQTPKP